MHIARFAFALFANKAAIVLANPIGPLTVHEFNTPAAQAGFCKGVGLPPLAHLDNATFSGVCSGQAARFLGIPYAQPPTCDRRLRLPVPLPPYEGYYDVHKFGPSCPQQRMILPTGLNTQLEKDISKIVATMYEDVTTDNEDCLTVNVFTPENATPTSKLPVLVWIFGGGFQIGGSANYDGGPVVARSVFIGKPVIFVSMNYRLLCTLFVALGFLPGKEVRAAKIGNLGLQDQRLAFKWVQRYITAFGGDPSKVTIWGESAGAISVALHMLVNNGDQAGLFRGAIMQSGGPIPVGDIDQASGQDVYDTFVKNAACDNSPDTLECLRSIPYSRFKYAMDLSPNFFAYQGLALAWLPRVDGVFLTEPPQHAVLRGHVANVPMITGMPLPHGSLFSLSSLNVSNTKGLENYMKAFMLPTATKAEIDLLLQYYPDDPKAGCPFDTGIRNILSVQFKRIAAIQGDIVFHGPRRFFLKYQSSKQNSWAFIHKRGKNSPFIGAAHATDLLNSFGDQELTDYFVYFAQNLNPNGDLEIPWPRYDVRNPTALVFQDSPFFPVITGADDYRIDPLNFVTNLSLLHPI
ncbi:carotenoid ester lipase precursor [Lactarius akahatsu]|uniref:Carboxylic ester hydrolase n=1 Tax=Lactarius akahatsu TaxID=416441 RepID=A0AAD4LHM4_9AGAM|nr:carotenoid ester lipase precursor [Lactarius akahatsu]